MTAVSDFRSLPAGAEALPPADSDYKRAIFVPAPDREEDWVLFRDDSDETEWVSAGYLVAHGFLPADRLGMSFDSEEPDASRVRISVDYPLGTGVYAWAVASQLGRIVNEEDVLHELLRREDDSALRLAAAAADAGEEK